MAIAPKLFQISGLVVSVTRKPIKNVYVRVDRASGAVRMSVPRQFSERQIAAAITFHAPWVEKQKAAHASWEPAPQLRYVSGEKQLVSGRLRRLYVRTGGRSRPSVDLTDDELVMCVRSDATRADREALLDRWLRARLKPLIATYVAIWEPVLGVTVAEHRIKRMKTRWGTCNIGARRIWLNLELARKPVECLEYVVVHEMVHLLEAGHTKRFYALMDRFLPQWKQLRNTLNTGSAPTEPD